jgi:hypothetical protein
VAALSVVPAASAQQGSAGDQYTLDLPSGTGSDQRGPGASSPPGNSLAASGGDNAGVVVGVLAAGLAAILCAGGLAAHRRRQMAGQTR